MQKELEEAAMEAAVANKRGKNEAKKMVEEAIRESVQAKEREAFSVKRLVFLVSANKCQRYTWLILASL